MSALDSFFASYNNNTSIALPTTAIIINDNARSHQPQIIATAESSTPASSSSMTSVPSPPPPTSSRWEHTARRSSLSLPSMPQKKSPKLSKTKKVVVHTKQSICRWSPYGNNSIATSCTTTKAMLSCPITETTSSSSKRSSSNRTEVVHIINEALQISSRCLGGKRRRAVLRAAGTASTTTRNSPCQ